MQKMKSFYNCSFFEQETPSSHNFLVEQEELLLKDRNDTSRFSKIKVEYNCSYYLSEAFDADKPCIIIPIKDNSELLSYTLSNLIENEVHLSSNITVVDDRSNRDLSRFCDKEHISYFRIENSKGFNFSMLNNIPAKIFHGLGCDTIVLWNSDLWTPNKDAFLELLKRHKESNSTVSGSKLLYPPIEKSFNKQEIPDNIRNHFSNMADGFRETVQFGGAFFIHAEGTFWPIHRFRFKKQDMNLANTDKLETFVTGALQVINLKKFIELGGLNPSLSSQFQDVDFCLRVVKNNFKVNYFGNNLFFYHDESLTLNKDINENIQVLSDHIIYSKIWHASEISPLIF